MATGYFDQTIPHTGTQLTRNTNAGPIVIDRTTCERGFHEIAWLEWNLSSFTTASRTLQNTIATPDCGTTSEGAKIWTTAGTSITIDCYTFKIVLTGNGTVNQTTGAFTITGSVPVTGGLTGTVSFTITGTITGTGPLTGTYTGSLSGDVVGTFTGTIAGSGGTTTYSLSSPANSIASGVLKFVYPSQTLTFNGSHSGDGTITGASFNGTSSGTITGDFTGSFTTTITGTFTTPTDATFSGTFAGDVVGTFTGTIVAGVVSITSTTITTPENAVLVSSPTFSVTSPTTFDYGGTFVGTVKKVSVSGTINGRGGVMVLYEHLTISSCARGGAHLEVRRVSDDTVVATYENVHHGLWENQDQCDLYLISKEGCTPGLCPWKIYAGVGGWAQVVGLRMLGRGPASSCEPQTVAPDPMKATLSSDGVDLGSFWDGFVANNQSSCTLSELTGAQTPIPAATFDFTNAARLIVGGFVGIEYEELGTITVVTGIAPDEYSGSISGSLVNYGIMRMTSSLGFRGRFEMDRTRVVGATVDTVNLTGITLWAIYIGQSDDICAGCELTLAHEWFQIGGIGAAFQSPTVSVNHHMAPFPINGNDPFPLRFYPTIRLHPTTITVEPA